MPRIAAAVAALALMTVGAAPVLAAPPCKDAKGKFMKCPEKKVAVKKAPCKDAKGKFIKCK